MKLKNINEPLIIAIIIVLIFMAASFTMVNDYPDKEYCSRIITWLDFLWANVYNIGLIYLGYTIKIRKQKR